MHGSARPRAAACSAGWLATRRLLTPRRRRTTRMTRRPDRGFVCAFVRGRWLGGWYETSFATVSLALGGVSACACRLQGLPSRFEALYLLYRLGNAQR